MPDTTEKKLNATQKQATRDEIRRIEKHIAKMEANKDAEGVEEALEGARERLAELRKMTADA